MVVASATLHSVPVKRLAEKLMYHPVWVDLKVRIEVRRQEEGRYDASEAEEAKEKGG